MDNPRIFLWIGLALLVWMNVIQWNRDYGTAIETPQAGATVAAPGATAEEQAAANQLPSLPTSQPESSAPGSTTVGGPLPATPGAAAAAQPQAPRVPAHVAAWRALGRSANETLEE